jgi:hypothetical protein
MLLHVDHKLQPNPRSAGWRWIEDRLRTIPGVVAMVRQTGRSMTLGPEDTAEVLAWIERIGWDRDKAPVLLQPIAR